MSIGKSCLGVFLVSVLLGSQAFGQKADDSDNDAARKGAEQRTEQSKENSSESPGAVVRQGSHR